MSFEVVASLDDNKHSYGSLNDELVSLLGRKSKFTE